MKNKLQIINKMYHDESIRTYVVLEDKKYYISIYDVVLKLTNYKNIQSFIVRLKKKLLLEQNKVVYNFKTFNLVKKGEGRYKKTEMVDFDSLIIILDYIPVRNKEYVKEFE